MPAMFERGPDEEGIETNCRFNEFKQGAFERGPDEEGIETSPRAAKLPSQFERGPDEEGIETVQTTSLSRLQPCLNADLTKKGLRLRLPSLLLRSRRLNADLTKKGLRQGEEAVRRVRPGLNADLTKKGLRPSLATWMTMVMV